MMLSAGTAAALVAVKLFAFVATGALSVAAALADSAMDLMIALGGLAAIYYAQRPADDDHAFGHSSAEDLMALAQAAFILAAGGIIGTTAIRHLLVEGRPPIGSPGVGIAAMGVSIVLTLGLVVAQSRIAAITGNRVVRADRLHYVGDLLPNLGAIVAIVAADSGGRGIDSVVALGAAAYLIVGAMGIGRGAWTALMDGSASPQIVDRLREIAAAEPGVEGVHDIKTRTAGSRLFVNLHVEIAGDLTLRDAHTIGDRVHHAIRRTYPDADVIVHHDPV